jgi:hypothetical protein
MIAKLDFSLLSIYISNKPIMKNDIQQKDNVSINEINKIKDRMVLFCYLFSQR